MTILEIQKSANELKVASLTKELKTEKSAKATLAKKVKDDGVKISGLEKKLKDSKVSNGNVASDDDSKLA